jgi:CBS domain containing-hemolysin-like protein
MIWIIFGVLTIAFLIVISAFFSSSEMAFVSINKAVIIDKARKGDKKAKILEELLKSPDNVISAIVIGNNLVNIFASILAGAISTLVFGNIGIGIATVVMMLLVLIFSEATPKAFGIKNEKLALKVAKSLFIITKLFHPMVILLNHVSKGLISLLGGKKREMVVTEHEIMAMMRLGEEEGTIEKDEREMVNDVFEFDETHVYEIYTPKDKVEFIREDDTIENLIQKSIKTGFSRFPAYKKDLDDIVGMVHVKDSLIIEDTSLQVKNIMRRILKIDSSMKVDDVLREMKRNKTHLALLQNRDGKTLGLVSMEDLIEEIFGEISDEHDVKS